MTNKTYKAGDVVPKLTPKEKELVVKNAFECLKRKNIAQYKDKYLKAIMTQYKMKDDFKKFDVINLFEREDEMYATCVENFKEGIMFNTFINIDEHKDLYNAFINKYNELLEKEKSQAEMIKKNFNDLQKKQQQGAEMKEEQERELIIKNAFEFLKRKDLIIVNGVITFPFLKANSLEEYETYNLSYCKKSFFCKTQQIAIKYKSNIYGLPVTYLSNDQNLIKLFNKTYNRLKTKQEQAEHPQDNYYLRKHDKGKPKLLQVPVEAIQAISEIMDYGSKKYGANTWQGVEIERYLQAGARHLYSVQEKDEQGRITFNLGKKDEESGIEHLKHALCNLAYVVALYEMKKEK